MESRFVRGGTITFDENSSTCQADFEVGEPQEAVLQWDAQQLKSAETTNTSFGQASAVAHGADSTESAMDGHIKSPSPRLAGYITASGYLYAQFADPVNAVVNSIWVGLTPFYFTI